MLLSLDAYKQQQFDQIAAKIMVEPEKYLCTRQISQNPYPIRVLPS
ncbi:FIG00351020: hypothetical protein [Acinetobacter baumannii]|nr:hypothetical protein [Acinetobacter baumannii]CQR67687.1 FIG00351020: hypothetical protein [Acinetobacter baumannii]CQR87900.1 FIG00351020: hypothetical protein [Acinetobacter baumannii]CRF37695.1 FIG00351020: hypothetical protein [Acinetobacter baumannii]